MTDRPPLAGYSLPAQIVLCPLTSLLLVALAYFFSRAYVMGVSTRAYSLSLTDLQAFRPQLSEDLCPVLLLPAPHPPQRTNQFYRIFTSQLLHTNPLLLFFNAVTLWECRKVEYALGSLFFARYSLLLLVAQTWLQYLLHHLFESHVLPALQIPPSEAFVGEEMLGCSGLVNGWVLFLAAQPFTSTVQVFGVLAMAPTTAPLVVLFTSQVLLPRANGFVPLLGMLSGQLLIMARPLDSLYWSLCFLLNLLLMLAWKSPTLPLFGDNQSLSMAAEGDRWSALDEGVNYESISASAGARRGVFNV